ncbi:MAG: hypothetical protein Q8Q09_27000 [Deltaproteobacteria bacterium]|nr:hypothetical protein [Deltaproteobacteria bacterium]
MSAAPQRAVIAIVEHCNQSQPGQRHHWSYVVCSVAQGKGGVSVELHREEGEGPLGRLRALQRARSYCSLHQLDAHEAVALDDHVQVSRAMFWAKLQMRLHAQGIL